MKKILSSVAQIFSLMKQSNHDGFVFIHINKTGGSSIEHALDIPFEHKTALEKIEEIGQDSWNKRLTFTVIRNPWDKAVSHYHYRIKTNQTNLRDNTIGFKEWVKYTYGIQDPFYYDKPKMFMPQVDWISNNSGKVIVDKIIYFESIDRDFQTITKTLGMSVALPHVKKSDRGNYREYYDAETIEIVRSWFEKDIKEFGYHF